MKVAIHGAAGRMGRTLVRLAAEADELQIVGAVDNTHVGTDVGELAGAGNLGVEIGHDLASALLGADMLIDFTIAPAFDNMLRTALRSGVSVVSGTTRLTDDSRALIDKAAADIAILWAPNMSVGIQVLAQAVRQAIAALGADYDIEVVEAHHNKKADAPSGTATFLVQAAQQARRELQPVHGREGQVGARTQHEIGVHALRGGGIVGDHTVHLVSEFDRLELTHRAMSRELFAAGALRAAHWLNGKPAGRYQLADVIKDS